MYTGIVTRKKARSSGTVAGSNQSQLFPTAPDSQNVSPGLDNLSEDTSELKESAAFATARDPY